MKIALIPARGGSKRIPRKNIAPFAGKPMLAWTIEAAIGSAVFDYVLVSTEDQEIASIATSHGAEVLLRPQELADDVATLFDVVRHTLDVHPSLDDICILLANCPLRPADEIIRAAKVWRQEAVPALLSVVDYGWTPPFRAQSIQKDNRIEPLMPDWHALKSQHYPKAVCPSGAIYWARRLALEVGSDLYVDGIRGFLMPWHLAIDIDTFEDLRLAACIRHSLDHGFDFFG